MANAIIGLNAKLYYLPHADRQPTLTGERGYWPNNLETGPPASFEVPETGAGTPVLAVADLVLLSNVRDVTVSANKALADVSTRGGSGWRQQVGTLKDGTVTTQMVYDPSDTGFNVIQDAFFADKKIALAVLSGRSLPTVALGDIQTSGLWADFVVTDFTRNEGLEEGLTVDVTFVVTTSTIPPQWVGITAV